MKKPRCLRCNGASRSCFGLRYTRPSVMGFLRARLEARVHPLRGFKPFVLLVREKSTRCRLFETEFPLFCSVVGIARCEFGSHLLRITAFLFLKSRANRLNVIRSGSTVLSHHGFSSFIWGGKWDPLARE